MGFNNMPFELNGKLTHRLQSLFNLYWSLLYVSVHRILRGPLLPNWNWAFETITHFVRMQTITAFDNPDAEEGRRYEDALVLHSAAVEKVNINPVDEPVKGHWYLPKAGVQDTTVLYLHGGGYAYYSKSHRNLIALVTLAAKSRVFVPDYRLIPEHPFPAQLDDARAAYQWLLHSGIDPRQLVVIGDSAGGNLTLALLLSLRDAKQPLPALAICISPWTDVGNSGDSMIKNEPYDWVEKRMADKWADWFCRDIDRQQPGISPIHADLNRLPPIYIQAGSAEILHDMIRVFADSAKGRGGNVELEVWKHMNHDFQAFGEFVPESREALMRIGQIVEKNTARPTILLNQEKINEYS